MENLVLERNPRIINNNTIITDNVIDSNKEITISIKDDYILEHTDIYEVVNNEIKLVTDLDTDELTVIYYTI